MGAGGARRLVQYSTVQGRSGRLSTLMSLATKLMSARPSLPLDCQTSRRAFDGQASTVADRN
jgi:hypothetical protein